MASRKVKNAVVTESPAESVAAPASTDAIPVVAKVDQPQARLDATAESIPDEPMARAMEIDANFRLREAAQPKTLTAKQIAAAARRRLANEQRKTRFESGKVRLIRNVTTEKGTLKGESEDVTLDGMRKFLADFDIEHVQFLAGNAVTLLRQAAANYQQGLKQGNKSKMADAHKSAETILSQLAGFERVAHNRTVSAGAALQKSEKFLDDESYQLLQESVAGSYAKSVTIPVRLSTGATYEVAIDAAIDVCSQVRVRNALGREVLNFQWSWSLKPDASAPKGANCTQLIRRLMANLNTYTKG